MELTKEQWDAYLKLVEDASDLPCFSCDRLRAQLAKLVEAARAYLECSTGMHTAGGKHLISSRDASQRLRAVLDEIEGEGK